MTIFVPQLDAKDVNPILRKHRYRLPRNCERRSYIARWHFGKYCGYGYKDAWIPLNKLGGMATKAWHDHHVRFPAPIDKELRALLTLPREGKS